MNDIQHDFDSAFALQYDSFIRMAVPVYDQLFAMAGSFLNQVANDAPNMLVVGAGGGAELL
jgi:tRNA (cmo5U34)-methyltransferase